MKISTKVKFLLFLVCIFISHFIVATTLSRSDPIALALERVWYASTSVAIWLWVFGD